MIILDTHVLYWSQAHRAKISQRAAKMIEAERNGGLAISAVTLLELANMIERGKITPRGTVEATLGLLTEGIVIKPITPLIASLSIQFPADFPRDPMDRVIAATARAEGLPLVTADAQIQKCPFLQVVW
ncbi:MAG: type II toxin-antitoxin system VapC family toxin [Terriglobales bacterium]